MAGFARHWQVREARFLGLVGLCLVLAALHLGDTLEQAGHPGSGHRQIDLKTLERRVRAGELRDREADWYHPATPQERAQSRP